MDLPAFYVATTESLLHAAGISHEMAHGAGGLLLYLALLTLPAARRRHLLPLLGVLLAELFNEMVQAAFHGSWRVPDTLADMVWTLCLPALLCGLAHGRRHSVAGPRRAPGVRPAVSFS